MKQSHYPYGIRSSWLWLVLLAAVWLINYTVAGSLDPYLYTIMMYAGINAILAVSLNLVNGFTGQFSIGHAGFMAVGGYTAAAITTIFVPKYFADVNLAGYQDLIFLIAMLIGGAMAAIVGYLVGLPSLRLKGDYLAIVTLGFGEIIRVVLLNMEIVGGARGMPAIPAYSNFGWVMSWVIITVLCVARYMNTAYGRVLLAVREDEVAAEAMGVNTTQGKVRAFTIGAFFAGVAGALFAHFLNYLNPSTFDFNRSFEVVIMVVLGGMGSITGSVFAAVFLTGIREALRPLQEITHIDFRMIIYSLMLIILMLTRPNGIFGQREFRDFLPERLQRFFGKRQPCT